MKAVAIPSLLSVAALVSACAATPDLGEESATSALETELACSALLACDGNSSPDVGPTRPWNRGFATWATTHLGSPNHRGRDQILPIGAPQWIIGKFAYGLSDKDLEGEDVDIFVERGCLGRWEKLGTARTTKDDQHPEIDGVPDTGGRIYYELPAHQRLAPGRHRVRLVVAGDHSSADLVIEVLPQTFQLVVSDVDGTLTSSESAEWPALLTGTMADAHPQSAEVLTELASRGYRPVYLTARPEWLTGRTREFLRTHGFPPGIIHTTTGLTGSLGGSAVDFKSRELALIAKSGFKVAWAFGNKDSDAAAYHAAGIEPVDHRVFLGYTDPNGGRRIDGYGEVLPLVDRPTFACRP